MVMKRRSAVSIFLAATTLILANGSIEQSQAQEAGGLKEWTTDQGVEDDSKLDADAAAIQQKAEQEDVCVPIGEGENCW